MLNPDGNRGQFYEDVLVLNHVLWWSYDISWSQVCLPNRISARGVMGSVLASSAVDRGFEPGSSQTKDYEIDMCCFSFKHAALRRKSKDWLANVQCRAGGSYQAFLHRRLLNQWFLLVKLKSSLRKFSGCQHDLVDCYGISLSQMTTDMFHLS